MQVHLINLDRSGDRLNRFHDRNPHLTDVVRFPGVDGRTLDLQTLRSIGVVCDGLNYSLGTIGCALSHVALWQKAVRESTAMTIAEDDTVFSRHFEESTESLTRAVGNDWDFILWSASLRCFTWLDVLPGGIGARLEFFEGSVLSDLDTFQETKTAPALLPARYLLGLLCYSVSPRGARALLDHCLPLRPTLTDFNGFGLQLENTGIDCVMNDVLPALRTMVCLPPLVINEAHDQSVRLADPA